MFGLMLLKECSWCAGLESRLFTDSWTGLELCIECLSQSINNITFSPEDDEYGDNIRQALRETVGPAWDEEEVDA